MRRGSYFLFDLSEESPVQKIHHRRFWAAIIILDIRRIAGRAYVTDFPGWVLSHGRSGSG